MKRIAVLATAWATMFALAIPVSAGFESPVPKQKIEENASKAVKDALASAEGNLNLLISTDGSSRQPLIDLIKDSGGWVTHVFKYADGVAAIVPKGAMTDVLGHPTVTRVELNSRLSAPGTSSFTAGEPTRGSVSSIDSAAEAGRGFAVDAGSMLTLDTSQLEALPSTYWGYTPDSMNALPVWLGGNFGQDSVVAVIDTGVWADHPFLFGRVIAGPDLTPDVGTAFEGSTAATNHWHGTHVAGIAAGSGAICLPAGDFLLASIELHTGVDFPADAACGGDDIVPLLGMAPAATLYAIKVFDHTGGSATEATVIAGIEDAIDQKLLYDASGGADGVDIDVINMSLGGWTGFDGRDLEDQTVDAATAAGITVVSAASNDGPYSMSINSPGTANSSVTAGAIAHPVNSRVFWDFNFGLLGIGSFLYTDDDPQVIYFSSRGPTADGRDKPTASAIGVFVLSSGTPPFGTLLFASGTSMATPGLAGTAALLNTYGETVGASPYDIKQAIVAGSHPVPDFDELDQGAGLIDAADALAALQSDANLGQAHPSVAPAASARVVRPKGDLIQNAERKEGITFDVTLEPGMSQYYYFEMPANAEAVTLDITNVDLGPVDLGLNSFEVYVTGGVRNTLNPYVDTTNVFGDASITIEDLSTTVSGDVFGVVTQDLPLMPGYWKVVIENDWTTFGPISGTFTIDIVKGTPERPDETHQGMLNDHENTGFFLVGHGPGGVELELSWLGDFTRYPASDMDLIVAWFDTGGGLHFEFSGATINAPELVVIDSADIAQVLVLIDAFNTYGEREKWTLDVFHR